MKDVILFAVGVVLVFALIFGVWYVGKKVNYSLSYKGMVQDEIRAMVKSEALK